MLKYRQLTFGNYGHTLNRRQTLSPDKAWVVYDTRNEDTHIPRTTSVERVRIKDGFVQSLYTTKRQSEYGPGVGAVAHHPTKNLICFIHGLENCDRERPYSTSRRFGAILDIDDSTTWTHAESRMVRRSNLRTLGVLSGGTHAHSWNVHDWISFTYNDYFLDRDASADSSRRNLRTVGFMFPCGLGLKQSDLDPDEENFNGTYAAFLAAQVVPAAPFGSDAIEQAVEECWIGNQNALVFQGSVRDEQGRLCQEVFRCDLPNETILNGFVLKTERVADPYELLKVLPLIQQRRLTFTSERRYPGIQGPRHWLITSPDAKYVYFLAKDSQAQVQLFRAPCQGGSVDQISNLGESIEGQISMNAAGDHCSFISGNRIGTIDLSRGEHQWLTVACDHELVGAAHWIRDEGFVVNAYVGHGDNRRLQILVCE